MTIIINDGSRRGGLGSFLGHVDQQLSLLPVLRRRYQLRPGSGSQASEAHVLDLQVLVDAVLGSLPAQAGLFDPAEGGLGDGQEALVDPHHAHLQRLGHPPDLAHVLRVEVSWQQRRRRTGSEPGGRRHRRPEATAFSLRRI